MYLPPDIFRECSTRLPNFILPNIALFGNLEIFGIYQKNLVKVTDKMGLAVQGSASQVQPLLCPIPWCGLQSQVLQLPETSSRRGKEDSS